MHAPPTEAARAMPPAQVAQAPLASPRLPRREFLALGDSLTRGGYAELVGQRFGVPVVNAGVGGQTPPQIAARYGALPVRVEVAGGRIVAGANQLMVVTPEILRASDGAPASIWAQIAGIRGVYSYSHDAQGRPLHRFTPQPGQTLPIDAAGRTTMTIEIGPIQSDMLLLCLGRNGGIDRPAQLKASIAAIMAAYRPQVRRIVLLGIINGATPDEARGTPRYEAIVRINRELAALYPASFLDIRAIYNAAGNPGSSEDRGDRLRDWPPASLRLDQYHYNAAGRAVWARAVGDFITRRRWFEDKQP